MKKLLTAAAAAGVLAAGLVAPAHADQIDVLVAQIKSAPCGISADEAKSLGLKTHSDAVKYFKNNYGYVAAYGLANNAIDRVAKAGADRLVECKAVKDDRNPLDKIAGSFEGSSGSSLSS